MHSVIQTGGFRQSFFKPSALMAALVFCLLPVYGQAQADNSWIQKAYHHSFHYEGIENFSDAIRSLIPVVQAFPSGYTVNLRLGWLYYLSGRYANATTHYQLAIQIAPTSIEAKLGLLLPQLAREQYQLAEQTAFQILRSDPHNYIANLRLIHALRSQDKLDMALKLVQKMLGLYPADVNFLVEMGRVYALQGNRSLATTTFQGVTTLDPENLYAKRFFATPAPQLETQE